MASKGTYPRFFINVFDHTKNRWESHKAFGPCWGNTFRNCGGWESFSSPSSAPTPRPRRLRETEPTHASKNSRSNKIPNKFCVRWTRKILLLQPRRVLLRVTLPVYVTPPLSAALLSQRHQTSVTCSPTPPVTSLGQSRIRRRVLLPVILSLHATLFLFAVLQPLRHHAHVACSLISPVKSLSPGLGNKQTILCCFTFPCCLLFFLDFIPACSPSASPSPHPRNMLAYPPTPLFSSRSVSSGLGTRSTRHSMKISLFSVLM